MFLQINTIKYDTDQEIMNIYENLQIVRTHFFTDMLLFIKILSTSNIYWFIGIWIHCQRIQTNNYSFIFDYSVRYSMSETEGNFKLFTPTYLFCLQVNDNEKRFFQLTVGQNKLECLSLLKFFEACLIFLGKVGSLPTEWSPCTS